MSISHAPSPALESYLQGFQPVLEPWPTQPLEPDPTLEWWRDLLATSGPDAWFTELQQQLPQLLLPQVHGVSQSDAYKAAVLRGEPIKAELLMSSLPWELPQELEMGIAEHPCGAMPVLRTTSWADFQRLVRALAHRCEPVPLADGVHAQAISGLIHWGLIRRFGRQARAKLIVLHEAPYGSVPAHQLPWDLSEAAWCKRSGDLRLEHELTHMATKRVLGQMRINLLDELIADAMGMLKAMGRYSAEVFGRCLGVDPSDSPQPNGRWTSYVGELNPEEAQQALTLTMQRANELEKIIQDLEPQTLQQPLALLSWLCQQQLNKPIETPNQQG
jgi:hypothetical protein